MTCSVIFNNKIEQSSETAHR